MKKTILYVLMFFAAGPIIQAQSNLELHLSPRLGAAPFALNMPVSAGSYDYKITRLEYYISEIKVTHDGGQETAMPDLYLLVRPAVDSMYDLGSHPDITNVESITFSIGVDQAHNHLDPASFPANHPLAPQNPAMQWGWSAGYRFVAIEGIAGTNFTNVYEIHALGDANYKTVTLTTLAETHPDGNKTIHLIADYAQILTSINVSAGLIVHGSSGKAVTLMNNMKNLVFSAESTTMTIDPTFKGDFKLSPNPAPAGITNATMSLPSGFDYRISLTDLTGKVLLNQKLYSGSQQFNFENKLEPGLYLAHIWQNDRPVAIEKLIVTQ
ncbi:MAG: T9SS type A sorting domain-containing protein [Saprospiraceae bacterium]|nr:T9SS type A sorting domain-containing protein [Saprospiraceae bacterium]